MEALREFIVRWISENYGKDEAEDPCYDVNVLSEEIYNFIKGGHYGA